jgi:diguanylate cyclase (GGDEF)-like protein
MPDGGLVVTHEDITERRQVERHIAFLAQHDTLTGLANRVLLDERIGQAVADAAKGIGFALLFLDLDRFKAVNDTFGHSTGDQLLRVVATRLLRCLREVDTAARLGGDEFIVLQIGPESPIDVALLARRIIDALTSPYLIGDQEVVIGVSIGIAIGDSAFSPVEVLFSYADAALYAAKEAGRSTFRFYQPISLPM